MSIDNISGTGRSYKLSSFHLATKIKKNYTNKKLVLFVFLTLLLQFASPFGTYAGGEPNSVPPVKSYVDGRSIASESGNPIPAVGISSVPSTAPHKQMRVVILSVMFANTEEAAAIFHRYALLAIDGIGQTEPYRSHISDITFEIWYAGGNNFGMTPKVFDGNGNVIQESTWGDSYNQVLDYYTRHSEGSTADVMIPVDLNGTSGGYAGAVPRLAFAEAQGYDTAGQHNQYGYDYDMGFQWTVLHEFGHTMGPNDEYTRDSDGVLDGAVHGSVCYAKGVGDPPVPEEWSGLVAPGDLRLGCLSPNWWRPKVDSILKGDDRTLVYYDAPAQEKIKNQLALGRNSEFSNNRDITGPQIHYESSSVEGGTGDLLLIYSISDNRGVARAEIWLGNQLYQTDYIAYLGSLPKDEVTFRIDSADLTGDSTEIYARVIDGWDNNTINAVGHVSAIGEMSYSVVYDGNGNTEGAGPFSGNAYSSGDPVTVLSGGSLEKTHYTFDGWNTRADGTGTDYAPGSDLTLGQGALLFAKWIIDTFPLNYTAGTNGHLTGTGSQTIDYGANGSAVSAVPDAGYHFVNWSDASSDNPRTDSNVQAEVSVTANFAVDTHTLVTTANPLAGGSANGDGTHDYGTSVDVTATANADYTFNHWSGDCNGTDVTVSVLINSDKTCIANFTASGVTTYTVTFDATGGSPTPNPISGVGSGDYINAPTQPTWAGHAFRGWYVDPVHPDTPWNFATNAVNSSFILYADWEVATTYTVTFDSQGGTAVSPLTGITSGSTITAPTPPTKANYSLGGWYLDPVHSDTLWNFATSTVTGDITLYAKWTSTGGHDIAGVDVPVTKGSSTISIVDGMPTGATGIDLTVTTATESSHTVPDGKSLAVLYSITATNQSGGSITTLSPGKAHVVLTNAGITPASTVLYWNGSAWTNAGITNIVAVIGSISFDTTHFSEFGVFSASTNDNGGTTGNDNTDGTGTTLPTSGDNIINLILNLLMAIGLYLMFTLTIKRTRFANVLA